MIRTRTPQPRIAAGAGPRIAITVLIVAVSARSAPALLRLADICRVKGQEENVLHGLGLVVGLKGTGDKDLKPTTRALAQMMSRMAGTGRSQPRTV